MDVEIDVQQNRDLLVTERQRHLPTGPGTGTYVRIIPLDFVDSISDVQVHDSEDPIPASVQIQDNQVSVHWFSTERGIQDRIFVLQYRTISALHIHDTDDQVYWKPFFTDPKAPIQRGSVTVRLPDSLEGTVIGFDSYGQIANTARKIDRQTVEFVSNQPIDPNETVKVQVIFPHSVFSGPLPLWQQKDSGGDLLRNLALGFTVVALVALNQRPPAWHPLAYSPLGAGDLAWRARVGLQSVTQGFR